MEIENLNQFEKEPDQRLPKKLFWAASLVFIAFILIFGFFFSAPADFPEKVYIEIEEGTTLNQVATILEENEIIKSVDFFKFFLVAWGKQKGIVAGFYYFEKPIPVFEIARRLVTADYRVESVSKYIPEGSTLEEMADILEEDMISFSRSDFFSLTEGKEGYLFPDTYRFFVTTRTEDVVKIMEKTMNEKLEPYLSDIQNSGKSLHEILTMASIIQKEAYNDYEEKRTISGILWKRIREGMLMQVDATFKYINGKGSAQLTLEDLRSDHPYNTYVNKGLPPGPIGSSSLNAIKAAIYPLESPYYFYLHGRDSQVRYAVDFDGHKENRRLYLD